MRYCLRQNQMKKGDFTLEYTLKLIDKNLLRQKSHELTGMAELIMIDSEGYDD